MTNKQYYLWYSCDDLWYHFCDWVVASSSEECDEIVFKKYHRKSVRYAWEKGQRIFEDGPRWLEYSKHGPPVKDGKIAIIYSDLNYQI